VQYLEDIEQTQIMENLMNHLVVVVGTCCAANGCIASHMDGVWRIHLLKWVLVANLLQQQIFVGTPKNNPNLHLQTRTYLLHFSSACD
jgi:hypothetical protein